MQCEFCAKNLSGLSFYLTDWLHPQLKPSFSPHGYESKPESENGEGGTAQDGTWAQPLSIKARLQEECNLPKHPFN